MPTDQLNVWSRKNKAYTAQSTLPTGTLWGFFGFSLCKPAAFSGQHESNQVSGKILREKTSGWLWGSWSLGITGPSNRLSPPSTPPGPLRLRFRSPGRFQSVHHSHNVWTRRKSPLGFDWAGYSTGTEGFTSKWTGDQCPPGKILQGYCTSCGRLCFMFPAGNNSKRMLCLGLKKLVTKGLNNVGIAGVIKNDRYPTRN